MDIRARLLSLPLLLALLLAAPACRVCDCDDDDCDDTPPPVPSGVYTVTGDRMVTVRWSEVRVDDLDEYRVYRSDESDGDYWHQGSTADNRFVDDDVSNGVTYYYAVTAVDRWGNESELSYETVFDTPRPDGSDLVVWDEDALAGVDFSGYPHEMIVPWDDTFADIFLFWGGGRYCFSSTDIEIGDAVYGGDLQYAGYVESLDELSWAPEDGWTLAQADTVSLYEGHAYWLWTWDNRFAKFRVTDVADDHVVIDWAYQIDEGNPELVLLPVDRGAATEKSPRAGDAARDASRPRDRLARPDAHLKGGRS